MESRKEQRAMNTNILTKEDLQEQIDSSISRLKGIKEYLSREKEPNENNQEVFDQAKRYYGACKEAEKYFNKEFKRRHRILKYIGMFIWNVSIFAVFIVQIVYFQISNEPNKYIGFKEMKLLKKVQYVAVNQIVCNGLSPINKDFFNNSRLCREYKVALPYEDEYDNLIKNNMFLFENKR